MQACTIGKKPSELPKIAADVSIEVVQPFSDDDYLASIKIIKIHKCYLPETCHTLPTRKETLAHFVFTHQNTRNNPNYRALRQHLPGVNPGSIIEAYIIAEPQKHGRYLVKVYEYEIKDKPS